MRDDYKKALLSGFFEAFFVVLAVILAIAAENWRQNADEERKAQRAVDAVLDEIESNRDKVQASAEYHQSSVQAIYQARAENRTMGPQDFQGGYTSPALVSKTAWEVAKITGTLANMDYEIVLDLSLLYESQARYEEQSRLVGQLFYAEMYTNGYTSIPENSINLASIISMFVYRENQLLKTYDDALSAYGRTTKPENNDTTTETAAQPTENNS